MPDRKVAILYANGASKRWRIDHTFPKQLADIHGEPLIKRTIRQFRERGFEDVYVVTRDHQIIKAVLDDAFLFTPSDSSRWLAQTVQDTFPLWNNLGLTFGAWGDVCWGEDGLDIFCSPGVEELLFYGKNKRGEAFGFTVGPTCYERAKRAIVESIEFVPKLKTWSYSMWAAYRIYYGIKPAQWHHDTVGWVEIPGWTKDIDTTNDHMKVACETK